MIKIPKTIKMTLLIGAIHFFVSYFLMGLLFAVGESGHENLILNILAVVFAVLTFPMAIMQKVFPNPPVGLNTFMIIFSLFLSSLFWGIFISYLIIWFGEKNKNL